jgi:DNA-binding MarR family transcriptional regulator
MMLSNANGTRALSQALGIVEEFRKLSPEIPSQTIATFLYIAVHDPCPMKELVDGLGVAQSTVSRNVAMLDRINRHHEPGLDLVRASEDPNERRRKVVRLTPRGRQLRDRINRILSQP